ncbi:MAG: methyltransferase [Pseudomonadota bacterium]|nr:methyltransferase [Pseudomonadota bacterium]
MPHHFLNISGEHRMSASSFTKTLFRAALVASAVTLAAGCGPVVDRIGDSSFAPRIDPALATAVASPTRTAANVARDPYRHPAQTLAFFGVEPDDVVVEVSPGGGWYTEILAPYLAGRGTLYTVASDNGLARIRTMQTSHLDRFGAVRFANFPTDDLAKRVPAGSADVVLTFRNVHNWMMGDKPFADAAFAQMFAMLKPGGTLGVVDHRLPESADIARERTSGYLKQSTVRRLAEAAGFEFVAASTINANPADTADHADGVWALPPTLRGGDKDRARLMAIGESDRMTLKFRKPG